MLRSLIKYFSVVLKQFVWFVTSNVRDSRRKREYFGFWCLIITLIKKFESTFIANLIFRIKRVLLIVSKICFGGNNNWFKVIYRLNRKYLLKKLFFWLSKKWKISMNWCLQIILNKRIALYFFPHNNSLDVMVKVSYGFSLIHNSTLTFNEICFDRNNNWFKITHRYKKKK